MIYIGITSTDLQLSPRFRLSIIYLESIIIKDHGQIFESLTINNTTVIETSPCGGGC